MSKVASHVCCGRSRGQRHYLFVGPATSCASQRGPKPPDPGPLFFSEHWRNPKTYKADALPLTSVTQEVVTTPDLVLTVYDPNAKYIPE